VDALTPTLDHVVTDRAEQVESSFQDGRLLWQPVPAVACVNSHFAGYAPESVRQLMALTDPKASA
jgi:hypothetical protein